MKRVYVIISLFWITLNAISQNYQAVHSGRIAYFKDSYGYISCSRVDSSKFDNDSVYYLMHSLRSLNTNYDCFTPYGASWMGREFIFNDSLNIFINIAYDSIKIYPKAKLNESWTAYFSSDSVRAVATVIDCDTMTFLGLHDSVKTIRFRIYDKLMQQLELRTDSTIMISKNYGLLKTYNFYMFPFMNYSYVFEYLKSYDLAGLSDPQAGIKNLTWFEVFDFDVGDEIHTVYTNDRWGEYDMTKYIIDRYLKRTDSSNFISYLVERKSRTTRVAESGTTYSYNIDTLERTYYNDSTFNTLPGEPVINSYEAFVYDMMGGSSKIEPSEYSKIWPSYDSCWSNCCVDDCAPSYTYKKSLGGPYYWCSDWGVTLGNELVYYQKGDKTWGTPLVVTSMEEAKSSKWCKLWPNPVSDIVHIEFASNAKKAVFELIDVRGHSIFREEITSTHTLIQLKEELEGVYIYQIYNENEILEHGKLFIR